MEAQGFAKKMRNTVKGGRVTKYTKRKKCEQAKNPLDNAVVLMQLFNYISTTDLMTFSQVNKKWNDIASTALIRRRACKLTLDKRFVKGGKRTSRPIPVPVAPHVQETSNSKSQRKTTSRRTIVTNMADLNDCIANATKFACTALEIGPGIVNLQSPNTIRFFELCGSKIKVLELNLSLPQPMKVLQNLFITAMPNIESLSIKSVHSVHTSNGNTNKLFPPCEGPVVLPSLKSISFDAITNRIMFQDLLVAAVNLQRIESCSVEMVEALEMSGKGKILKGFILQPKPLAPLFDYNLYVRLAALELKLEHLIVQFQPRLQASANAIVVTSFGKIIKSSSQTLKSLDLRAMSLISQLPHMPVLPVLETLSFGNDPNRYGVTLDNHYRIFPLGCALAQNFPNLKNVVLRLNDMRWTANFPEDNYSGYLPNSIHFEETFIEPFSTVENLVVETDVMEYEIRILYAKFPNIKHVVFKNFGVKFPLSSSVWNLPSQVESMEFTEVRLNLNLMNSDAFFTGFYEGHCANLRKLRRDPDTVDFELLTINPSIRMAKNLKRFKMALTHRHNTKPTMNGYFQAKPFISEVTGLYAFSRMPELNVVFSFDFDGPCAKDVARTLRPLKRYVQLVSEKFRQEKEN